jgi:hypothetical protein
VNCVKPLDAGRHQGRAAEEPAGGDREIHHAQGERRRVRARRRQGWHFSRCSVHNSGYGLALFTLFCSQYTVQLMTASTVHVNNLTPESYNPTCGYLRRGEVAGAAPVSVPVRHRGQ